MGVEFLITLIMIIIMMNSTFPLREMCLITVFNVVPFGITKTQTSHCDLLISTVRLLMRSCSLAAKASLSVLTFLLVILSFSKVEHQSEDSSSRK